MLTIMQEAKSNVVIAAKIAKYNHFLKSFFEIISVLSLFSGWLLVLFLILLGVGFPFFVLLLESRGMGGHNC